MKPEVNQMRKQNDFIVLQFSKATTKKRVIYFLKNPKKL